MKFPVQLMYANKNTKNDISESLHDLDLVSTPDAMDINYLN
jgi:hypothetical protein